MNKQVLISTTTLTQTQENKDDLSKQSMISEINDCCLQPDQAENSKPTLTNEEDVVTADTSSKNFLISDFSEAAHEEAADCSDDTEFFPVNTVIEEHGKYLKVSANGKTVPVSNFIIDPVALVSSDREGELIVNLVHENGIKEQRVFSTADLSSVSKFKAIINQNSISYSFKGASKDMEDIKQLIDAKPYDRKVGVSQVGFAEVGGKMFFVTGEKTVDFEGNDASDVVLLSKNHIIQTDILGVDPITIEELNIIGPSLFNFNDIKRTVPIMAFMATCFVKEKLRKSGIKFCHLALIGEAGSGKSETLENIILPIFGTNSKFAASKMTGFTTMRTNSSSNTIPQVIEEYKSAKISAENINSICNLLRESYDGQQGQRGTSSFSIEFFDLRAPIILVGENTPQETAIRERFIQILFAKIDHQPERQQHLNLLKDNRPLLQKLGRVILNKALELSCQDLQSLHTQCLNIVEEKSLWPSRINNTVANALLGLEIFDSVCSDLGTSIEEVSGFSATELSNAIFDAIDQYLMDGRSHNRSIVDSTFEIFDRMDLIVGRDYKFVNKTELAIRVRDIYDRFLKFASRMSDVEVLSYSDFRTQVQLTSYYIENNRAADFPLELDKKKVKRKAFIFDYSKLSEAVDLENIVPSSKTLKAG